MAAEVFFSSFFGEEVEERCRVGDERKAQAPARISLLSHPSLSPFSSSYSSAGRPLRQPWLAAGRKRVFLEVVLERDRRKRGSAVFEVIGGGETNERTKRGGEKEKKIEGAGRAKRGREESAARRRRAHSLFFSLLLKAISRPSCSLLLLLLLLPYFVSLSSLRGAEATSSEQRRATAHRHQR